MLLSSSNDIGREEKHGWAAHNQSGLHDSGTLCEAGGTGGTQTLRQSLGKIILFRTVRSNHTTSDKPMRNILRSSPEDSGFYDPPGSEFLQLHSRLERTRGDATLANKGLRQRGRKPPKDPYRDKDLLSSIGLSVKGKRAGLGTKEAKLLSSSSSQRTTLAVEVHRVVTKHQNWGTGTFSATGDAAKEQVGWRGLLVRHSMPRQQPAHGLLAPSAGHQGTRDGK